jgi:hypothetical protein
MIQMPAGAARVSVRVAVLTGAIVLVCSTGRSSAHDPTTKVTYTREIVRLLDQHCVSCHRPGGRAPMAFTSYAESRPWAHAMKEMVFDRAMPPWPAAPGYGDFSNDPTLTPFEAGLLEAWADGGAPNGIEGDLPMVRLKPDPTEEAAGTTEPADTTYDLHCGKTTLERPLRAVAITPHAKSGQVSVSAQTPDGAVQPLIVIPAFDVRYPLTYRFRRVIDLPKGTVIDARGPASGCEIDLAIATASRQP